MNDETHKDFLLRIGKSRGPEYLIQLHLRRLGYYFYIPPIREAKSYKDRADFKDEGDCFIKRGNSRFSRIEVKGLSINFNRFGTDWPYRDFIICRKSSYDFAKKDKSQITPFAYFVVSADYMALAMVKTSSYDKWTYREVSDVKSGEKYQGYIAPPEVIKWGKIMA
jgi:hypothetical protein